LANEAKLNALREEISGLTPDRINVLTPSEANQVLSKYSQVLAPDLQRLLRKRL
jgi:DNA-directed RNA polymerase